MPQTPEQQKVHDAALKHFRVAADADDEQRQRELEDLKFAAGNSQNGYQWPLDVQNQRKGGNYGGIVVPPRPCLTINKLKQPIQQLENQQRNARLGVQISPKGSQANQKTAEMLQGLYRNIEVESRASIARNWSYSRALKCGRGVYRVNKVYANDGDFDQDLVISRILNQHAVVLDPFAQEPDWSDGERAWVLEDFPAAKYRRMFPDSEMAGLDDEALTALGAGQPGWIGGESPEARTIRVAEYWRVEHTQRVRVMTASGWSGFEDEKPRGAGKVIAKRDVDDRKVVWALMNALEILQEQDWDGRYIPLIPVIASEDNINGERVWEGIVAPAKDAQRVYNYMRSAEVETIGLAPKAPFIMAEGQDENYARMWEQANTVNFPRLVYKPVTLGGQLAPPPERNVAEPPIQAISMSVMQADSDIQSTTGKFDPSLGKSNIQQSGIAIKALQQQDDLGNSGYLDNLASISMTYEAKVILDLIPKVYDRPGRVARILGLDDAPSSVMLNQPFTRDEQGEPQEALEGMEQAPGVEHYDLSQGSYACVVTIGKAIPTARKEATEVIGQILQAEPQLLTVIGDLWVGGMDFPGSQDIAERLKKMLPPQLQEDDKGQPKGLPPEAQQQIAALQQQLQQAQQMADANAAKVQTAQIKAQSDQAIAQIKAEVQTQIEQFKAFANSQLEAGNQQSETARTVLKVGADAQQQRLEHAHDHGTQAVDLAHDGHMAQTAHIHNTELAAMKPAGGDRA